MNQPRLHIICDRDVGLFALVLSVVPHVHWALNEGRIPIVYYGRGNCYWTPSGYSDRDTVWEYYFEPVIPDYPASRIPPHIREKLAENPPDRNEPGQFVDSDTFASSHPGGLVQFEGERLKGSKETGDASEKVKWKVSELIRDYVRPRDYIREKADRFFQQHMAGRCVVGVHIRGTDALVDSGRALRENRINFRRYFSVIDGLIQAHPEAIIFVASDAQSSVDRIRERFGERVVSYDSVRHVGGEAAGKGPTGRIMPAYLTADPDTAARNGEDAIVEYLLFCRCHHLVHNSSSIPRAVLWTVPGMPETNTIPGLPYLRRKLANWRRLVPDPVRRVVRHARGQMPPGP